MKSLLVGIVCLSAVVCGVTDAAAQVPSCGAIEKGTDIYQNGHDLYVVAQFSTSRELTPCPIELQTEGWIGGVGGADSYRHATSAPFTLGRPIPNHQVWHAFGKHWLIWYPGLPWQQWQLWANTHDEVLTTPPPADDPPPQESENALPMNGSGCPECNSPLLVDIDGDGFELTSAARGVQFDLDADGALDQVAWTKRDSGDAWLAFDRNGNGRIDDGTELFGNHTPAYADTPQPAASNGFVALRFTEGPTYGQSLADDQITGGDAIFARLLLWRDANHNGISEPDELTHVRAEGLIGVSTDYRESRRRDRHGNEFRQVAASYWQSGRHAVRRAVVDVWLQTVR